VSAKLKDRDETDRKNQEGDSRDRVKHIERSDLSLVTRMMVVVEKELEEMSRACCEEIEER